MGAGLIPAGAGQTLCAIRLRSRGRAHPRRCGADRSPPRWRAVRGGSSPQVRGRLVHHRNRAGGRRLIPAGAGQTGGHVLMAGHHWAHPRRCGADPKQPFQIHLMPGSSPQVRGRPPAAALAHRDVGLIPAGAGQTSESGRRKPAAGAHPRRCGADNLCRGLSPARRWLIPAGAGQTRLTGCTPNPRRAHPRRCGADTSLAASLGGRPGSSPQVRGRLPALLLIAPHPGLIPAGAGQTAGGHRGFPPLGAHPRRCRADVLWLPFRFARWGSSPQVRGRQHHSAGSWPGSGLIPAGAGQTIGDLLDIKMPRAHPRRCGADCGFAMARPASSGSSPQVRGRLERERHLRQPPRLIPAGAGQTR